MASEPLSASDRAFIMVVFSLLGFGMAAWIVITGWMLTVPHEIAQYEEHLARIETTEEAYNKAASACREEGRITDMQELVDCPRRHPEIGALSVELDQLKKSLPDEPPTEYGKFVVQHGSRDERARKFGNPWFFYAVLLVAPLFFLGGLSQLLSNRETPEGKKSEAPAARTTLNRAAERLASAAKGMPPSPESARLVRAAQALRTADSIRSLKEDLGDEFDDPAVQKALRDSGFRLD